MFEQSTNRTSVEAEILLYCARTGLDAHCRKRLNVLMAQEVDWEYLLKLGFVHGVLPLLYSNLRKVGSEFIPSRILGELRRLFWANAKSNLFVTAELFKLVKALEIHGIPAVPFKGPLLAVSAYQNLALRQFGDLDILVRRRDIVEAGRVIVAQGYRHDICENDALDEREPDPDEVAFVDPRFYIFNGLEERSRVDLQWRISGQYCAFSLDEDALWERRTRVSIAGRAVRTFEVTDLLLILCIHGSKHCWEKLKWVCDVAELLRARKSEIDWEEIQRRACKQRTQRILRLGLFLAQQLIGAELPKAISEQVRQDSTTKRLAQQIRNKLFAGADRPLRKFKRAIFYIRTRDQWHEGARFCFRYIFQCCQAIVTPTQIERRILPLPMSLSFVYFFFRPLRLMAKYCRLAVTGVYKWGIKGSGLPLRLTWLIFSKIT